MSASERFTHHSVPRECVTLSWLREHRLTWADLLVLAVRHDLLCAHYSTVACMTGLSERTVSTSHGRLAEAGLLKIDHEYPNGAGRATVDLTDQARKLYDGESGKPKPKRANIARSMASDPSLSPRAKWVRALAAAVPSITKAKIERALGIHNVEADLPHEWQPEAGRAEQNASTTQTAAPPTPGTERDLVALWESLTTAQCSRPALRQLRHDCERAGVDARELIRGALEYWSELYTAIKDTEPTADNTPGVEFIATHRARFVALLPEMPQRRAERDERKRKAAEWAAELEQQARGPIAVQPDPGAEARRADARREAEARRAAEVEAAEPKVLELLKLVGWDATRLPELRSAFIERRPDGREHVVRGKDGRPRVDAELSMARRRADDEVHRSKRTAAIAALV